MKVLNLYAGIGGNRKLWEDVDVTAVECSPKIAEIYKEFFPNDNVIIDDAHQYLLDHFKEFDFIWSSPPCPTHSEIRRCGVYRGQYEAKYPDMKLYEEIILLKFFAKKDTKWIVENVKSYYKPLIQPYKMSNHYLWSNFHISEFNIKSNNHMEKFKNIAKSKGFNDIDMPGIRKDVLFRNCVNPHFGLHILNESKRSEHQDLFK